MSRGVPSIADVSSAASRDIALALLSEIGASRALAVKPPGQTAGKAFETVCADFIGQALSRLSHLWPVNFSVGRGREITRYDQYAHLAELQKLSGGSRALRTALGSDYLIKPDIVVVRLPEPDTRLNENGDLVDESVARRSFLRAVNGATSLLHASISCKLTIRSDRVQNTRSEALNLMRNRKGRVPHIMAVTAEPLPSRIAAIAMGTGDIDCVYHFALPELLSVVRAQGRDSLELMEIMIEGNRLRDIADLPLDLVV